MTGSESKCALSCINNNKIGPRPCANYYDNVLRGVKLDINHFKRFLDKTK